MSKTKSLIATVLLGLAACSSVPRSTSSLAAAVALATEHAAQPYQSAMIDLNGDGQEDAIILLSGTDWCGTGGCTLLVFKNDRGGYSLLSRSTVTRPPIRVSPTMTNGWKDLVVSTGGIGDVLMQFDGAAYPGNPSMQSVATPAQVAAATIVVE
jgi:type II secretory pathway pseudopilin PulG